MIWWTRREDDTIGAIPSKYQTETNHFPNSIECGEKLIIARSFRDHHSQMLFMANKYLPNLVPLGLGFILYFISSHRPIDFLPFMRRKWTWVAWRYSGYLWPKSLIDVENRISSKVTRYQSLTNQEAWDFETCIYTIFPPYLVKLTILSENDLWYHPTRWVVAESCVDYDMLGEGTGKTRWSTSRGADSGEFTFGIYLQDIVGNICSSPYTGY